jgi:hypothetical protein
MDAVKQEIAEGMIRRLQRHNLHITSTSGEETIRSEDLKPEQIRKGLESIGFVAVNLITDAAQRRAQLLGVHDRLKTIEELKLMLEQIRDVRGQLDAKMELMGKLLVAQGVMAVAGLLIFGGLTVGAAMVAYIAYHFA